MKTFAPVVLTLAALAGAALAENPVVVMDTSLGTIKLELFEDKAPATVNNFLDYVAAKHYDGTIFHRVMGDFVIQGGGIDADKKEKATKPPIKNEWQNGLKNDRGTIAMARQKDPNSASAQWFINVKDNPQLNTAREISGNAGYCVFGKVVEGMDVVDKIKAVRTGHAVLMEMGPSGLQRTPADDVPVESVVIKSVKKVESKNGEKKDDAKKPEDKP
jgi:cyclophilin family peptidyl-prolyl cis-trans isomerase